MSLIEKAGRRIKRGVDTTVFFFKHDSTPQVVERARKVVIQNEHILQGWLDDGLVTRDRLQEIEENEVLQKEYKIMMKHARDGGSNTEKALQELKSWPIDKQAGWLGYFRKFHKRRFNADLLREEEFTV